MVEIRIELDYFFDGTTPLHIKESPNCTTPGEMARKISGNFIGAFTGLTDYLRIHEIILDHIMHWSFVA